MYVFAFAGIQLVPDGTVLIHIALVLLMIWVLNRTFFRPINRVIASRDKNKGGRSIEAEEIMRDVEVKRSKYDAAMREARSEGYELIEKERVRALKKKEEKLGAVKESVAASFAEQSADLEKQTAVARTDIADEARKLAERISSNILKA